MTPARVLYLSYDGLTDPLGQSQILPYVSGLSQVGYQLTIISFEKKDAFKKGEILIRSICRESNITWVPLTYTKKPPVLSTLFDILVLWLKVKSIYRSNPFQIIHCRSYLTSLIGLRAKRKWGVKFIFDMRGFWADERVEGGLWDLKNPVFKWVYDFFKRKEKQFIINADHVVSLTHNARQEIESWGVKNAPITVIPTCVDLELFNSDEIRRMEQQQLRDRLGVTETDFVLLYLGSWGTWYLTKEMLDFFATLKQLKPQSKFLIVSPDVVELPDPIAADCIVQRVNRSEVPLYISLASLGILFIKPSYSKKASSATKAGEMMAMQLPIVTNLGWGDTDQLVLENKSVLAVTEFSKESMESVLIRILSSNLKSGKHNLNNYSLKYGVKRYAEVYAEINEVK